MEKGGEGDGEGEKGKGWRKGGRKLKDGMGGTGQDMGREGGKERVMGKGRRGATAPQTPIPGATTGYRCCAIKSLLVAQNTKHRLSLANLI